MNGRTGLLEMASRRPRGMVGLGRLGMFSRLLDGLPVECTLLALLMLQAAGGLPGRALLQSAIGMGAVFFWARILPSAMPPVGAFLIGLLLDLLGLAPLGVGPLTLLLLRSLALLTADKRLAVSGGGLLKSWAFFLPAALMTVLLGWALICVLDRHMLPLATPFWQFLAAVLLYPLLAAGWTMFHRRTRPSDRIL